MTKVCEACGGKGWITGPPFEVKGGSTLGKLLIVERCDICKRFVSDWAAAVEANRILPGTLRIVLSREA